MADNGLSNPYMDNEPETPRTGPGQTAASLSNPYLDAAEQGELGPRFENLTELEGYTQQDVENLKRWAERSDVRDEMAETAGRILGLAFPSQDTENLVKLGLDTFASNPEEARRTLEIGGGILGGAFPPLRAAGRVGPVLWRALQSGLGEAAGGGVAEVPDPSKNLSQAGQRAVQNLGFGAAGSVAGDALFKGASKALAPFAKKADPAAELPDRVLRDQGAHLTAGQRSESNFVDIMENIAAGSFAGSGKLNRTYKNAEAVSQDLADKMVRSFVGGRNPQAPDEVGERMTSLIQNNEEAFKGASSALFKELDRLTGQQQVNLAPVKQKAKNFLEKREGFIPQEMRTWVNDLINRDNFVSWEEAQNLRSDYLSSIRQASNQIPSKTTANLKQMAGSLDGQMEFAAKNVGEEAAQVWRLANQFHKRGMEKFNKDLMRKVAQSHPEHFYRNQIRGNSPSKVREAKKAILENPADSSKTTQDGRELWQEIQGRFLGDLMQQSDKAKDAARSDPIGERAMRNFNNMSEEAKKEIFGDNLKYVKESLGVLKRAQAPASETGKGRMAVQMIEPGLFSSAGTLAVMGYWLPAAGAFSLALSPKALSTIVASKKGAQWLSQGIKAGPKTQQASRASAQLLQMLEKEGELDERGQRFLDTWREYKKNKQRRDELRAN